MENKLIIFVLITLFYTKEIAAGKKLIVVLIDGFRWDYINDPSLNLKGIPKIIERGVRAPYVNPVFPSLSYPNTYTIVTGHSSGVGSSELRRAVQDVDEILHDMVKKIDAAGLQNEVNIMVVSDHGMTNVQRSNATDIDLEQFASNIKYQASYGATMMLVPEDGMLDKLYTDLKQANVKGLQVYKKEKIPESFHLKESPRVSDIFLKARKGYFIKSLKDPNKVLGGVPGNDPGYHGFDPDEVPDMRSIFFATGPGFRRGVTSKPLNNTDLYNMMCRVLNIQPLPNNGSMELVEDILSQEDPSPLEYNSASSYVQGSICIISLHFVFVSVLLNKYYSQLF